MHTHLPRTHTFPAHTPSPYTRMHTHLPCTHACTHTPEFWPENFPPLPVYYGWVRCDININILYFLYIYRFVISSGDIYNFHFVKNEKMFSIRDSGGMNFSIPLNSAVEFGVLYNPRLAPMHCVTKYRKYPIL